MSRYNIIFLIIFFTFILPGPPAGPVNTDEQYRKLSLFRNQLYHNYHQLQNGSYYQGFGNLTGFMLSYEDVLNGQANQSYPIDGKDYTHWYNNQSYSILPDELTHKAQSILSLESGVSNEDRNYYTNISSSTKGRYHSVNNTFTPVPLQLPDYLQHFNEDLSIPSSDQQQSGTGNKAVGNVTVPEGSVSMEITVVETINRQRFNPLDSQVKLISIDFDIADDDETDKHSIETRGFYFPETGNIISMSSSAKFMSLYGGIQHLTVSEKNFALTKNLTLEYFDRTFFTQPEEGNADISYSFLSQLMERTSRHCEYVAYFHLNTVNLSKDELSEIDKELTSPIGRPINFNTVPQLNFTGFLYSPDCGVQLEVPTVVGVRREIKVLSYQKAVILGMVLLFAQILLTVKQMNYTNTPSTISRISFWSICLMSLVDGSLSMIYLVSSAVLTQLYLPLTVSAFLSFILSSMFEMRFLTSIYMSQINERTLSLFTALQGRPLDGRDNEEGNANGNAEENNGLPTTRQEATNPAPTTADPMDESQVSGIIYTRFFFTLIVLTFVMMNSVMWSKSARGRFEYFVLFVFNSYWLPQAYRNVVRGSHRSFKWWFIIGTTTVRTIPLFYLFVVKGNVFDHHYDPHFFLTIVSWLSFQIFILVLQGVFGARFFLPEKFLPQTYNYHPALTEQDLESGFGVNHVDISEETPLQPTGGDGDLDSSHSLKQHSNGHCVVDCAICMTSVDVPILKSNLDQAATFLQRRAYMVAPCRHIFHTQCLEAWMKYKLQCPVCRNSLPPL